MQRRVCQNISFLMYSVSSSYPSTTPKRNIHSCRFHRCEVALPFGYQRRHRYLTPKLNKNNETKTVQKSCLAQLPVTK